MRRVISGPERVQIYCKVLTKDGGVVRLGGGGGKHVLYYSLLQDGKPRHLLIRKCSLLMSRWGGTRSRTSCPQSGRAMKKTEKK